MERRYLVANKIDLSADRVVDEELGQRVRRDFLFFFEKMFSLVCITK
jgi:hypothetical protein